MSEQTLVNEEIKAVAFYYIAAIKLELCTHSTKLKIDPGHLKSQNDRDDVTPVMQTSKARKPRHGKQPKKATVPIRLDFLPPDLMLAMSSNVEKEKKPSKERKSKRRSNK